MTSLTQSGFHMQLPSPHPKQCQPHPDKGLGLEWRRWGNGCTGIVLGLVCSERRVTALLSLPLRSELPQQSEADPQVQVLASSLLEARKGVELSLQTSWPQGCFPGTEVEIVRWQPARSPCFLLAGEQPSWGGASTGKGPVPGAPLPLRGHAEVTCGLSRRQEGPSRLCLQERSFPLFSSPSRNPSLAPPLASPAADMALSVADGKEESSQRTVWPAPHAASQTGEARMRCHLLVQGCCWLPGGAQVPPAHVLPSLHHTCATHFSHRQARVRQTDMQEYIPLHISEQEALPSRHFRSGETVTGSEYRRHTPA